MPAPSGSASAGSRRFWITILCFAIANLGAWIGYHKLIQPTRRDLLVVEQFAPGDHALVGGRPRLTWRFNIDAAPRGVAGPVKPELVPCAIQPMLAGAWSWDDARTLAFEPAQELPKATEFKLTVPVDKLMSPDGFVLAKPDVRTVHTSPLALNSVHQVAFDDQERLILEVNFNDTVIPADVVQHLSVLGPESKYIKYTPWGDNTGSTFRLMTDSIAALRTTDKDNEITVRVTSGLKGASGPLGLESQAEQRLEISKVILATEVDPHVSPEGDPYVSVRFNNPVDVEKLRQVVSIEPQIPITLEQNYMGTVIRGPFQCGTRYSVKIAKAPVVDVKGFPRATALSVFVPDRHPAVWFKHMSGYLGSQGNRTLLATAVNLPGVVVNVTRVYDNNLVSWRTGAGSYGREADSYGRPVATKHYALANVKNKPQELRVSMDDLLGKQVDDGAYRLTIAPDEAGAALAEDNHGYYENSYSDNFGSASCLVTLSDIGLTSKQTHDAVLVWAVSLSTGKPLEHVRVRAYSNKNQPLGEATTGADGLARVGPMNPAPEEGLSVVLADAVGTGAASGAGLTWLDTNRNWNLSQTNTGGEPYFRKGFEGFVYTDRGVYRPGENVVLRAIVRGIDGATPQPFPVKWQIRRPDGRDWQSRVVTLDADGAAEWKLDLPSDLATGYWSAHIGMAGENGASARFFGAESFQIEEFIPDRMKMALTVSGNGLAEDAKKGDRGRFVLADKPLLADVQADYLFGQPAAGLATSVVVRMDPSGFHSKKWAGWSFGDYGSVASARGTRYPVSRRVEVPEGKLNDAGHLQFEVNLAKAETGTARHLHVVTTQPAEDPYPFQGPWTILATATVSETGGRSVTAMEAVEADELGYYVGLRNERTQALKPGEAVVMKVALIAPNGELAGAGDKAKLEASLYKEVWNNSLTYDHGQYHYNSTRILEEVKGGGAPALSMTGAQGTCTMTAPTSGTFVLCVRDKVTKAFASMTLYASNGEGWDDNVSRENPEHLDVRLTSADAIKSVEDAADENERALQPPVRFQPGQKIRAIVRSPFAGQLLLTVETDDVLWTRVIDMAKPTAEVEFDLPAAARPNAYVTASVIRPVDSMAKWQTHRAYGAAPFLVDHTDRKLTMEVVAPPEMRPGNTLDVLIRVKDAAGQPVRNAAIALAAVDEGICRLTRFETPNPLEFFNAKRALAVQTGDLYDQLLPEIAKLDGASVVGGGGGEGSGAMFTPRPHSPITAKRVKPVSLVADILHTDAEGVAHAHLSVPEFIGQLRVMGVGYAGNLFGSTAQPVYVKSPLIVQSSWPRFAAPGDRFDVPLVVFNNTTAGGLANVTIQMLEPEGTAYKNPLQFADKTERKITLPVNITAGGQAQLNLTIAAAQSVGIGKARLDATLNGESFTETIELPVRPPSPAITRGDYLTASVGKPLELTLPDDILPGTGQLNIRITPKPDLYLPDGLQYLDHYPYGCVEQTTSQCFPLVYLNDIGDQIAPGMFDKDRLADKIQVGVTRLIGMQTADGGLAMWQGGRESWPWATVYATHFLIEAQAAGHKVPEDFFKRLVAYVRMQLDKPLDETDSVETQAYAAYVLAIAGKPERAAMNRISEVIAAREKAGKAQYGEEQARFYLAAAWLASGRRDLATGLIPQALPLPRNDRQLNGNVGSPIRDQAIVINTLLAVSPDHPALPGLVEKLANSGRAHKWYSTQDNAMAIMALGRYLRATKADLAYDHAEWAATGADAKTLATADQGRPLLWNRVESHLTGGTVTLSGKPGAKGYVVWAVTGVPLKAPADADNGVKVRRRYLDENGKPITDSVRSGQLVHVEITVDSKTSLEYLVLEDLLPAGLEIENPRLASAAGHATPDTTDTNSESSFSEARLDVRDDRLVVIGNAPAGHSRYVYTARAITPGVYIVPPVHAECMYDIGTNSLNGGGATLKVTAPAVPAGDNKVAVK